MGCTASQLMKLVGNCEYLFVDEAGQVTMELLAVLARKAQNLLLVLRRSRQTANFWGQHENCHVQLEMECLV